MAKILIIKLGALGDMVMATSLIRQIQDHHKTDKVWLLTSPDFTGIFENWNNLDVVAFERKGLLNFFKSLAWIRRNHFNYIYDLQSNDRTSVLCALAGVRNIVGNHPRYPYNMHPPDKYIGQCHIHERMLAVLASAGIQAAKTLPVLPVSKGDQEYVSNWLQEKGLLHKKIIIMHAGASIKHPEKCWPYFMELAVALSNKNCSIIWTGTQAEAETNKQRAKKTGADASKVFSINQLAELGRHAKFAITNDSGPMHILSGSGIPVFAFFGPTNWRRNHAIDQAQNVITLNKENKFLPVSLDKITVEHALMCLQSAGVI